MAADILPFVRTLTQSRDWSPVERDRLEALGAQLAGQAGGIEISFGRTDDGDPWCVVTDEDGEVLVHVARIGGRVIVHRAADDVVQESGDLRTALHSMLGADWQGTALPDPGQPVVVPFAVHGRRAQTLAALVVANAFFEAFDPFPDAAHAAMPQDQEEASRRDSLFAAAEAPMVEERATTDGHEVKRRFDVLVAAEAVLPDALTLPQHGAPIPNHGEMHHAAAVAERPANEPAAEPEGGVTLMAELVAALQQDQHWDAMLIGGAGDDRLVGSDERDLIMGGDGDDVLLGGLGGDRLIGGNGNDLLDGGPAQEGVVDLLDGGAGDDRLMLNASTVALGGAGADSFIVAAPPPAADGGSSMRLGILLDFTPEAGDRLAFAPGVSPDVTSAVRVEDLLTQAPDLFPATPDVPPMPGFRVGYDFNADGREDGHLLINGNLDDLLAATQQLV